MCMVWSNARNAWHSALEPGAEKWEDLLHAGIVVWATCGVATQSHGIAGSLEQ